MTAPTPPYPPPPPSLPPATCIQVQNGMQLLDRLMKDVVTESERFDATGFLPLIGERIFVSNPFSRQVNKNKKSKK